METKKRNIRRDPFIDEVKPYLEEAMTHSRTFSELAIKVRVGEHLIRQIIHDQGKLRYLRTPSKVALQRWLDRQRIREVIQPVAAAEPELQAIHYSTDAQTADNSTYTKTVSETKPHEHISKTLDVSWTEDRLNPTADYELTAITAVMKALDGLTPDETLRVLKYVKGRIVW